MDKLTTFTIDIITITQNILSDLIDWLFQASYYIGIGTGILLSGIIIIPLLDKILTRLTYHYETTTFAKVSNPPKLTKVQIELLKDTLYWWNHQCDSWYISKPVCVDNALNGHDINLVDVQRLMDSTHVGHLCGKKAPAKTQTAFNKLKKALAETEKELIAQIKFKKSRKNLVNEMDIMAKQLQIARYSAIAAIASAAATAFLAYITYINMQIAFN